MHNFSTNNHRYKGDIIRYHFADISMCKFLVASTDKGICLIELGQTAEEMLPYLQSRFRYSTLVHAPNDEQLCHWTRETADFLEDIYQPWTAPLDVRGTNFQLNVWKALMHIKIGNTLSYGEIASHLERPKAYRAVGAAVGHNPIAIHIPCHRIIGKYGSLTGFRWGLPLKRWLLDREGISYSIH